MREVYIRRDLGLEKEFGEAIELALNTSKENGAQADKLYQLYVLGGDIESKLMKKDFEGFEDELSYLLLKSVFEYAHLMHDEGTQNYCIENPSKLKKYADQLLGRVPATFPCKFDGKDAEITYIAQEIRLTIKY